MRDNAGGLETQPCADQDGLCFDVGIVVLPLVILKIHGETLGEEPLGKYLDLLGFTAAVVPRCERCPKRMSREIFLKNFLSQL